ncbi:MAG TPA: AmiS/UreI family transporter [Blastococcus sp.]
MNGALTCSFDRFLWFLFFLLLGLKWDSLGTYTGYVTAVEAWVTAAIPGFLLVTGYWRTNTTTTVVPAVIGTVMAAALWPLARCRPGLPPEAEADVQKPASTRPIDVTVTHPVDMIADVIALAFDRRSVTGVCPAP